MPDYTDHQAPQGLRTRGTVIVVPGRGEGPATYQRFGRRLAADAYRVRVVDALPSGRADADVGEELARLAAVLTDAVDGLDRQSGVVRPLVLVGVDAGAAAVAALVDRDDVTASWWPEAVILAGLPGAVAGPAATWDEELATRTSCPVHRRVLTDDHATERGALAAPVPRELLDAAYRSEVDLPRLVLVGDADPLADRDRLAATVSRLPHGRLTTVRGAHHDVLNDLQHRSVAAEIVTFLEVLRNELVPVLAVESSTW